MSEPTWEQFAGFVAERLWKLAPEDINEFASEDVVFGVTMQDLREVVLDTCAEWFNSDS